MKLFGQGVNKNGLYDLQDWPIVETINGKVCPFPKLLFSLVGMTMSTLVCFQLSLTKG